VLLFILYQISYKSVHWGLLGKRVKCNKNYFLFIYTFFLRLAYKSDLLVDLHVIAQKT